MKRALRKHKKADRKCKWILLRYRNKTRDVVSINAIFKGDVIVGNRVLVVSEQRDNTKREAIIVAISSSREVLLKQVSSNAAYENPTPGPSRYCQEPIPPERINDEEEGLEFSSSGSEYKPSLYDSSETGEDEDNKNTSSKVRQTCCTYLTYQKYKSNVRKKLMKNTRSPLSSQIPRPREPGQNVSIRQNNEPATRERTAQATGEQLTLQVVGQHQNISQQQNNEPATREQTTQAAGEQLTLQVVGQHQDISQQQNNEPAIRDQTTQVTGEMQTLQVVGQHQNISQQRNNEPATWEQTTQAAGEQQTLQVVGQHQNISQQQNNEPAIREQTSQATGEQHTLQVVGQHQNISQQRNTEPATWEQTTQASEEQQTLQVVDQHQNISQQRNNEPATWEQTTQAAGEQQTLQVVGQHQNISQQQNNEAAIREQTSQATEEQHTLQVVGQHQNISQQQNNEPVIREQTSQAAREQQTLQVVDQHQNISQPLVQEKVYISKSLSKLKSSYEDILKLATEMQQIIEQLQSNTMQTTLDQPINENDVANSDQRNISSDSEDENVLISNQYINVANHQDGDNSSPTAGCSYNLRNRTTGGIPPLDLEQTPGPSRSLQNEQPAGEIEQTPTPASIRQPLRPSPNRNRDRPLEPQDDDLPPMVPIGCGATHIPREEFVKINFKSYTMATRGLMTALFPRDVMATHSLSGKRSPAFKNRPPKMCLDKRIVSDIIQEVSTRYSHGNVQESHVRLAITTKCADEAKMHKQRLEKERQERERRSENQENIPPNEEEETGKEEEPNEPSPENPQ